MHNNLNPAEMCKPKFIVIGISDSHVQYFSQEIQQVISQGRVFSGGKRHHEIMLPHLPEDCCWIDITVPLEAVYAQYANQQEVIVFASGDPLFYGFATTLKRQFPKSELKVYPTFNSLQSLAHKACLPYHNMTAVSLTGRPWKNLDAALIEGRQQIGVLTDKTKTPDAIAQRMLQYGYTGYVMTVGERLGNEAHERVSTLTLEEAAQTTFEQPNCLLLQCTEQRKQRFGIPESEFHHLQGRNNMITKMPIRLLALQMLDITNRTSFWDIGFCTGSVSIEARLLCPTCHITAFEIRQESEQLIQKNSEKFGAPSINYVIGNFMDADLSCHPAPDCVFIGGHGGQLTEMLEKINRVLLPGGAIVFNSVSEASCQLFKEGIKHIGKHITASHRMALDEHHPITVMKAE